MLYKKTNSSKPFNMTILAGKKVIADIEFKF